MDNIKKIHMGPAKCAVDLGDGSERGEYVNQDYILNKLDIEETLARYEAALEEYFGEADAAAVPARLQVRKISLRAAAPADFFHSAAFRFWREKPTW